MAKIKNSQTGEVLDVKNLGHDENGVFVYTKSSRLGEKWLAKFPMISCTGNSVQSSEKTWKVYVILNDGWNVDSSRKPRTPRAAKVRQPEPEQPQPEQPKETEVPEPKQQPEEKPQASSVEETLINSIRALRGNAMDEARVREIFKEMLEMYAEESPKQVKLAAKKASGNNKEEVYCQDFDDIVDDISDGFHVYLYGPAGSGKSHTAEQVAERLGLDFYGQTTIQFAHDVRGYGDAAGKYQDTPFFKAFKYGGLYFQDEYDRSNSEAAIVLNSALANGWYDFPICGRVEAHPNFRFMAAGNTKMTGPDEDYVTGQIIDASSRDRFATMYKIDYLRKVELRIANGDTELVDFMEDIRKAIANTNVKHIVSYRATKYATKRKDSDKQKVLSRSILKGLETDEIRIIYGELSNTSNVWAKAMRKLF